MALNHSRASMRGIKAIAFVHGLLSVGCTAISSLSRDSACLKHRLPGRSGQPLRQSSSCLGFSRPTAFQHSSYVSSLATQTYHATPGHRRHRSTSRAPRMSAAEAPSYYVTTPIYYVNDQPHIGHAYTTLACDVIARWKRLDGYDVKFLSGTDEHGQKVQMSAEKAGVPPQEFCDKVSGNFRDLLDIMDFSVDDFIRTTQPRHKLAAEALWNKLVENDEIYLGAYEGWYSVRDEAFYTETDLVDGKAPTGADVEWIKEPSYFFRLSKWQTALDTFYEENPSFISPKARKNEVLSFMKEGLRDLSVSRTSFSWGLPVPQDDGHVMYVWVDALTNYITAAGFPDETASMDKWWPADLHVVGKDILRFHAVYWPALLMAAGLEPPKKLFAHGWWTIDGAKMSKSVGNVVSPVELVEQYGVDPTRFFLMSEVAFGNDGDFSHKSMVSSINTNLANDLGNLLQRVTTMVYKNCEEAMPVPAELAAEDQELLKSSYELVNKVRPMIEEQQLHHAVEAIILQVREGNKYIDTTAPWALRKTDLVRMGTVLHTLAESMRCCALLLLPFMPASANRILDQLGVAADARTFSHLTPEHALPPGQAIPKPVAIFPRIVVEEE